MDIKQAPLGMSLQEWQAGVEFFAKAKRRLSPEQTIKVNAAEECASAVYEFYRATNNLIRAEKEALELGERPDATSAWRKAVCSRRSASGQMLICLREWQRAHACTEQEAIKQIAEVVKWLEDHESEGYGLPFYSAVEHIPMAEALSIAKTIFLESDKQLQSFINTK